MMEIDPPPSPLLCQVALAIRGLRFISDANISYYEIERFGHSY